MQLVSDVPVAQIGRRGVELLVPVFVQGIRTVLIVEIHRVYRRHHTSRIERVGIVGAVGLGLIVVILRRARKVEAGAEPFVGLEVRRDTAGETLKIVVFDVAVLGKVGKRSEDIVTLSGDIGLDVVLPAIPRLLDAVEPVEVVIARLYIGNHLPVVVEDGIIGGIVDIALDIRRDQLAFRIGDRIFVGSVCGSSLA